MMAQLTAPFHRRPRAKESLPSNHTYAPQITSDSPTLCIPFICGERHIAQKKVSLCTFLHMVVLLIP